MEHQLMLVVVVQLILILFLAVSILLFLLNKLMVSRVSTEIASKTIVVTGADTPIGAHISTHLASIGFRVFAGVSDINSTTSDKLRDFRSPWLHVLALDVTNDESIASVLKSASNHFHAGEKGLWAVLHLAGATLNTKTQKVADDDDKLQEALEVTVIGFARLMRLCLPLLSAAEGRFITLGAENRLSLGLGFYRNYESDINEIWTAARFATGSLALGLRSRLRTKSVSVVTLQVDAPYADRLNSMGRCPIVNETKSTLSAPQATTTSNKTEQADDSNVIRFLSSYAMGAVEDALLCESPAETYVLTQSTISHVKNVFYCLDRALSKQYKFREQPRCHHHDTAAAV